jgi:3-phosphoshikimate 1-carboxyvinyltransferase
MKVFAEHISGVVSAPPSKSALHRRLILNRIAGRSELMADACTDIQTTAECLSALGTGAVLNCRDCGAALRFLLPVSLLFGGAAFAGTGALASRPILPLIEVLREHGAVIKPDSLPLSVRGTLKSGQYALPGGISSQFFSGLMMTLPFLSGDSTLEWTSPLESAGYVRLTERMLKEHGVVLEPLETGYRIPGGQCAHTVDTPVDGDWSCAATMLVLGAIAGSVTVTGLDLHSEQPDRRVLDVLEQCGAHPEIDGDAVTVHRGSLRGFKCNGSDAPDLVPVLAALGCASEGDSVLYRLNRLRYKESDRFGALTALLDAVGADFETERNDTIVIHGSGCVRGGFVDLPQDHRMVMAATLLGACSAAPVAFAENASVNKSYPAFFRDFAMLGGTVDAI